MVASQSLNQTNDYKISNKELNYSADITADVYGGIPHAWS